jgi:hypothetical protein
MDASEAAIPPPLAHPLSGDTFKDQYVRAHFLSSLCTDYCDAANKLVAGIRNREDPYRGNQAEALLAVVALRNVSRLARAVQHTPLMPQMLKSAIKDQLSIFSRAHPKLETARDVIEHADQYMRSKGNKREHWFDLTQRFGDEEFLLRVSGDLDLEMVRMVEDAGELSLTTRKAVQAWFYLEQQMKPLDEIAQVFIRAGKNVKIERVGGIATVTVQPGTSD